MTDHPTCETCRFLREIRDGRQLGNCMRYPPVTFNMGLNYTGYPIVGQGDWCGEYQPVPWTPKDTDDPC